MKITKNSLLDLRVFIYTKALLFKCTSKKTISPNFSSFLSRDITHSDGVFWKKHSSLTSVLGDIWYHATHRWKAYEEQIRNIYTFMT